MKHLGQTQDFVHNKKAFYTEPRQKPNFFKVKILSTVPTSKISELRGSVGNELAWQP